MKTPRFLLGAAILFWGWQVGLLFWAVPMALILEVAPFIKARWEFSTTDLKRIWNLCAVLFFGAGFILYTSEELGSIALKFVQWLPFSFYAMMLAQVYGTLDKMPLTVFSWFLRRKPDASLAKKSLNISYLYFGLVLLAASGTTSESQWFYLGVVLLISFALLANRPARVPQPYWIVLLAVVSYAGNIGHQQLRILHGNVEGTLARWLVSMFSRNYKSNESRTAIGRVGRVHLSGNIVFRLQPESPQSAPGLLRDASFDVYGGGVWRGSSDEYTQAFSETNDVVALDAPKKLNFNTQIASYLRRGRGRLALPQGTYEVGNFLGILKTNRLGVARVEEGPGLLNLMVHYGPGKSFDGPPGETDLDVPLNERAVMEQIVEELQLNGKTEREKLQTIAHFFQNNFTYSLEITRKHLDRSREKTPVGQFLTEARSGHCEYFATAAVMLLREAGIPARYATGYLVDESSRKGKTYLVRERDGHAWVLAYRESKGIWEEFDPTPTSDRAQEHQASSWESFSDFLSNLKFVFSKWRWSETTYTSYLKWLLIPLVLILVWRIVFSKNRKRKLDSSSAATEPTWPGMDSELYLFNEKMTAAGLGRHPNELLSDWQKRLSHSVAMSESLDPIFSIHRRLRFDPKGLTKDERRVLKTNVTNWLKEFDSQKARESLSAP